MKIVIDTDTPEGRCLVKIIYKVLVYNSFTRIDDSYTQYLAGSPGSAQLLRMTYQALREMGPDSDIQLPLSLDLAANPDILSCVQKRIDQTHASDWENIGQSRRAGIIRTWIAPYVASDELLNELASLTKTV